MSEQHPAGSVEWTLWIVQYADSIYVRARVGDEWSAYRLSELSPEAQAEIVKSWIAGDPDVG